MKCNLNKLSALILALVMVVSLSLTAYAHEAVDLSKEGSITISVKYNGKGVPGAIFTCVQMGYVEEVKGTNSGFHFYRLFDDVLIEDNRVKNDAEALANELDTLYRYNRDRYDSYEWSDETGKDGTVTFYGLQPGLYLIRQPVATEGYSKMSPFLVSVPYALKDSNGELTYEYDVTVSSKSELEREPEPTKPPDKPDDKLPQTGQLNWPVPILAVSGMALFAAGWVLTRKETQNEA